MEKVEKNREEKESKRRTKRAKVRRTWEKFGKWFFLFLILGQNWLVVSAASKEPQSSAEAMMRMQQGVRIKGSSWKEVVPKWLKQQKGEDRTDVQKDARRLRCT